jgi:phage gp36-like protein
MGGRAAFNVSVAKQQQALNDALNNSKALLGTAVGGLLGTIGLIVLIPIYVFYCCSIKRLS